MSEVRTALLVLIGGRQTPNVLSAQYLRPDVIAPIASHEAMRSGEAWDRVRPVLEQLSPKVLKPETVDAFDLREIRARCAKVMDCFPDARWVCNVTCATTVMSIGAYEEGRARNADVWYFDTAGRRVVALAGQPPPGNPYRLSVEDYLRVYNRAAHPAPLPLDASWLELARQMAHVPDEALEFREKLRSAGASASFRHPRWLTELSLTPLMVQWCEQAQAAGFIDGIRHTHGYDIHQIHGDWWRFVDGLWLEIYAWDAAQRAACFDDCRFDIEIPAHIGLSATNQIDLAVTHAASLLIAECKTEGRPFRTEHLDQLRAIASMIGGSFVGILFITARSEQQADSQAFSAFTEQAKARQIVVVTGNKLGQLPDILKCEASRPTYPRG